jgi:hypothetical protein
MCKDVVYMIVIEDCYDYVPISLVGLIKGWKIAESQRVVIGMIVNYRWNVDASIGVVIGSKVAEIMKIWVYTVGLHASIQEILPTKIKLGVTFMSLHLYVFSTISLSDFMKDSAHAKPNN